MNKPVIMDEEDNVNQVEKDLKHLQRYMNVIVDAIKDLRPVASMVVEHIKVNEGIDMGDKTFKEYVDHIEMLIEMHFDPIHCPTCGSCGEAGCCAPSRCESVRCLYGEHNITEYRELLEENEKLRNDIIELKTQLGIGKRIATQLWYGPENP